ncbi:hypothetical protein HYS29_01150, partial [Candidatus Microgenomates bacterium]|nr:hypothetical protein [Candidatus Microgenomates bacterium]
DAQNKITLIKGLVPGAKKSRVIIEKTGEAKKFIPVYQEEIKEEENKDAS